MEKRKGILELRDRMDKTLSCPDIADEGSLRSLVKKQILESSLPGSNQGLCAASLGTHLINVPVDINLMSFSLGCMQF
jgi:hypothetical protein